MEQSEEWVTGRRYVNKNGLDNLLKENRPEQIETNDSELDLQQEVVLA